MANDSLVDVILERFPEEADDVMALYRYLYAKKMLLLCDAEQLYQIYQDKWAYQSFLMTMESETMPVVEEEVIPGFLFLHPELLDRVSSLIAKMRGKFQDDEIREYENDLIRSMNQMKSLKEEDWMQYKYEFLVYETLHRLSLKEHFLKARFVLKHCPEVGLLSDEEVITATLMDFDNFTNLLLGNIVKDDPSYLGTISYLISFCESNSLPTLKSDLKAVLTILSSKNRFPYNVQAAKGLKRVKQYESLNKRNQE